MWSCPLDSLHNKFRSQAELKDHITQSHGDIISKSQVSKLLPACITVPAANSDSNICKLCLETFPDRRTLSSHLATKMEEIALFAIPRSAEFDEDTSSDDVSHSLSVSASDEDSQILEFTEDRVEMDEVLSRIPETDLPKREPYQHIGPSGRSRSMSPSPGREHWHLASNRMHPNSRVTESMTGNSHISLSDIYPPPGHDLTPKGPALEPVIPAPTPSILAGSKLQQYPGLRNQHSPPPPIPSPPLARPPLPLARPSLPLARPTSSPIHPGPLRKRLTDVDRRAMCKYHETHPFKKQTEIGGLSSQPPCYCSFSANFPPEIFGVTRR